MKTKAKTEKKEALVINAEYQHQYGNGRRYIYLGQLNESHGIFYDAVRQMRINLAFSMIRE